MAAVDRNIMRAAVCELLYFPDVPPAVAINEALEIAKKYSSSESVAFINGVLDRISRARQRP
jgi:N utilization substance protein B